MSLQEKYKKEIVPKLLKALNYKNSLAVPRLKKIVVNVGLREALGNKQALRNMALQLAEITGQKPVATKARRSISGFRLRAGNEIGLKVTLRGKRMYNFFEKLVSIVLPRVRDFRGVSERSFDNNGNYTLGFKEQTVFPELEYSKIDKIRGLEITIVTTAKNPAEGKILLELLGMPFSLEGVSTSPPAPPRKKGKGVGGKP